MSFSSFFISMKLFFGRFWIFFSNVWKSDLRRNSIICRLVFDSFWFVSVFVFENVKFFGSM